jgi:hypothetical protein
MGAPFCRCEADEVSRRNLEVGHEIATSARQVGASRNDTEVIARVKNAGKTKYNSRSQNL